MKPTFIGMSFLCKFWNEIDFNCCVIFLQEVVDRCAALSAKPDAIPNLIAAMDKLNDAYHDVDGMLQEIMELIKV